MSNYLYISLSAAKAKSFICKEGLINPMKKSAFFVICLILISMPAIAFDLTGNLVKLPMLKNLIQKSDSATAAQPPSEDNIVLREGSISLNRKRADRYSGKQAFLVSDKDWHNVLSLVPVSMWYEGSGLKKYPALIYHEEDTGFDADSVITFLKQYNAKKVVLVGDTPEELDNILIADGYTYTIEVESAMPSLSTMTGMPIIDTPVVSPAGEEIRAPVRGIDLTPDWLTRISPDDYTRFWSTYDTVVVSEDNYQLGLLASVYASYLNAPLFFEGRVPAGISLSGKRVITAGRTSYAGEEAYTLEQLERKLLELYPTDKIILANPDDLTISETKAPIGAPYRTMLTNTQINEIYSKTSLSAPFLAAAKKEILLTTASTDYRSIDSFLENKIASLRLNPKYLTIIASPIAIPMDKETSRRGVYEEIDNHIYGDINADGYIDIAVGRISSITPSDVSAYIARDIFIENFRSDMAFATLWPVEFSYMKVEGKTTDRILRAAGLAEESIYLDDSSTPEADAKKDFENKLFIDYQDHGNVVGVGAWTSSSGLRRNRIRMDPSVFIAHACLTCGYSEAKSNVAANPFDLFCTNMLRHGTMAYVGAVDESYSITTPNTANVIAKELAAGKDTGSAFLALKRNGEIYNRFAQKMWSRDSEFSYEPLFVLIGDPTIKLFPASAGSDEITTSISSGISSKTITINIRQPSDEVQFENIGSSGITTHRAYVLPSGSSLAFGERRIHFDDPSPYPYKPRIEDIIYIERDAGFRITSANLKIRYSDGTERNMPLALAEEMYSYSLPPDDRGVPPVEAHLLALNVGSKQKLGIVYREENMDFRKILPAYSYELRLQGMEA